VARLRRPVRKLARSWLRLDAPTSLGPMRLALIANPGSGSRPDPEALADALRAHGPEVEVHSLDDRDNADADRVVVAGGDGSVGPAAELAGRLGVALAVVPAGTANDFARAHRLPLDRWKAIELAALGERTETLELGRLDGRPFVNVVSAGLAPAAARHAEAHKSLLGPLAYMVGALKAGVTAHPVPCEVRVDERPLHDGEAWQVIVSVSGHFGGGSEVDAADPGDGLLHVTVVPGGSRLALGWRALGMRLGYIAEQRGVVSAEARLVDLGLPPGEQVNLDGEVCGPGRATVEPAAFRLVVPAA
jgi:diacylglycerol kinase (ATP)